MQKVGFRRAMLNCSSLLFLGRVKAVVDDDSADVLSCADKDAAFALIATTEDDVIDLRPGVSAIRRVREDAKRRRTEQAAEADQNVADREDDDRADEGEDDDSDDFPVRVFFFCRDEEDRHWLHGACFAQPKGVGLAAIELDPTACLATCSIRVPGGVREIAIIPAG